MYVLHIDRLILATRENASNICKIIYIYIYIYIYIPCMAKISRTILISIPTFKLLEA